MTKIYGMKIIFNETENSSSGNGGSGIGSDND